MNLFKEFRGIIIEQLEALTAEGRLPPGLDLARVAVEPPRDPEHGDMATNAAMVLAKAAASKPRDLAEVLAEKLSAVDHVSEATVAGPGFINLRLEGALWMEQLREILRVGTAYGTSTLGQGQAVNVEYVSANPTGPLTVGHARGAVVGDALAALLAKVGYAVTQEYYINDAGGQVDVLARSAYLRYREALGEDIGEIPEGFYPGDYLKETGKALAERDGDKWMAAEEADWLPVLRRFAIDSMMDLIRRDLAALGVHQDVFSSEKDLVQAGGVDAVLAQLEEQGLIYTGTLEPPKGKPPPDDWEPRPQLLFKATEFGDDVDRALKKSDGSWTYFANDMAYHLDKFRRGFPMMIDVWGADHGGYIKRMQAGVKALTQGEGELDVKVCQLVNLKRGGAAVKMSKRAGTFVTLREVIDEVGKDVVRFIMLTRKNDASLDFDLEKVVEKTLENPVFYVQMAHARCRSVLRLAAQELPEVDLDPVSLAGADLNLLTDSGELGLIKQLAEWPRLLEAAAEAHEPHRVAFYLYDVAAALHAQWNRGQNQALLRFLLPDEPQVTRARLALLQAVAFVIASGLEVFGVEPVEELR